LVAKNWSLNSFFLVVLLDLRGDQPPWCCRQPSWRSSTEWGSTCRRLSDAQLSKSV